MAISRNECPLLEFSTDGRVYQNPETPEKTLSRLCLVTAFEDILEAFVARYGGQQVEVYENDFQEYPIYLASVEGYEVCATLGCSGASAAARQADFLYGHGAQTIMFCGSCDVLDPELEGSTVVIPVRALRAEGASYHYLPAARYIDLQDKYVAKARSIMMQRGIPYAKCITWTTDAPYRASYEMVEYRRGEGCRIMETQCAAMAAVAQCRGKGYGAILYAGDPLLPPGTPYDEMYEEDHEEARKKVFLLAIEVLCRSEDKIMHTMELQSAFFDAFRHGEKEIEVRCMDEKRRNIRVGDVIQFQKSNGAYFKARVCEIIAADSFGELYERVTPEELGFAGKTRKDFISTMRQIYTLSRERELGVVGFRVRLLPGGTL
jgi:ASC-1-like (ASCH) protein/uridine phosphorylase